MELFTKIICVLTGFLIGITISSAAGLGVATKLPAKIQTVLDGTNLTEVRGLLNNSRRILKGTEVHDDRPYMVYLKLPTSNPKYQSYRSWMCGGVILSEEYILTSAACIEDARNFYVVSGTYIRNEQDDKYNNQCIKNGAKKAVWKCVPRNYVFDGHENDNIRWMNNDIAVVKLEDELDFNRRVKGCDFVPKPICYNNRSEEMERPGIAATIAGWGSTDRYSDWVNTRRQNTVGTVKLLETTVRIIRKNKCRNRWGPRYHNIIENYMICTMDVNGAMSEICDEKYVDCQEVASSDTDDDDGRRLNYKVHSSSSHFRSDDSVSVSSGGFCENDHGGPLVHGEGLNAVVIGVISACLVKGDQNRCYGPFLYTSVWKNRILIDCAITGGVALNCNKMFRAGETHVETVMDWSDHPDGPSKYDIKRRQSEEKNNLHLVDASSRKPTANATAH